MSAVRSSILGRQIAVYMIGRQKPMTELTVCQITPELLIARANGSTHLINPRHILCIRFAPDSEPGRDRHHPLHDTVAQKGNNPLRGRKEWPCGPRNSGGTT